MGTYDEALDNLYRVFARYPFRRSMPCCIPHCMDQAELDVMGSKPLREISATEMQPFAANLNTTCGELEDFKFVLPRLFELSSDFQFPWPDTDLVFSWLRTQGFSGWPTDERQAVTNFLDGWWDRSLHYNQNIDRCFEALSCTGEDVTPWLIRWRLLAPASLAEWIVYNIGSIWAGSFSNSFADDRPLIASIDAFLGDPETAQAIAEAFETTDNDEHRELLYLADSYLQTHKPGTSQG